MEHSFSPSRRVANRLANVTDEVYRGIGGDNLIATTLDEWYKSDSEILVGGRRMGNTTRQINYAIQKLFEGKTVVCLDHHDFGSNYNSNRRLYRLILQRLDIEHQGVKVEFKANKYFTIKLTRDYA